MSGARRGGVFRTDYDLGEVVYLKLADEPKPGMICRISILPGGEAYHVTWGDYAETTHYAMELTRERPSGFGKPDDEADE